MFIFIRLFGITYQTPVSLGNSSNSDEDDGYAALGCFWLQTTETLIQKK